MSLVAYGSSDSEDEEKEGNSKLVEQIPKKQRETVKIIIPSLKQFEDDDPAVKTKPVKITKAKTRSGLFSILPPPKHSVSSGDAKFIPYVFTRKKDSKPAPQKKRPAQKATNEKTEDSSITNIHSENDDLDTSSTLDKGDISASGMDFFSLNIDNNVNLPQAASSSDIFSTLPKPVQTTNAKYESSSSSLADAQSDEISENLETYPQYSFDENANSEITEEADPEPFFLKDDEFKKLRGKREREDVNIIDVNARDQLTGKDQWLIQSLTEERVERPSKRRHDMPTQQQKRKHQITYLAFQAKERELDLKNQWASNSRTRRETQAKYGF